MHEKTAIHYGWYSNKSRGTRKAKGEATGFAEGSAVADGQAPPEGSPKEADRATAEVRRNWARMIRKVYEVDPLICPQCGGTMKIVALIQKPDVIRRILTHLKLGPCAEADRGPPSPASSSGRSPAEPRYEPLFDDLPWEEPTLEGSGPPEWRRGIRSALFGAARAPAAPGGPPPRPPTAHLGEGTTFPPIPVPRPYPSSCRCLVRGIVDWRRAWAYDSWPPTPRHALGHPFS